MTDRGCKRDGEVLLVDFLTALPPELVLQIALCLTSSDVTRCLLVCHAWWSRLCHLEPYWRIACRRMGLSGSMIENFGPSHSTSRELYLAALSHMRGLATPPPTTVSLTQGYPYNIRYSHQYAKHGYIIGTLYQDFRPKEMVVETVKEGKLIRTHTLPLAFQRRAENRIIWGHRMGHMYMCATASGRWSLYNLHSHAHIYSWPGDPMYFTDLKISCCERCGLAVTARLISFHSVDEDSFWNLQFTYFGTDYIKTPSHAIRFKLYHKNSDIVGRRVQYGKRQVCLIPAVHSGGACSRHLVLLQWANTVAGYVASMRGESAVLSGTPHLSYTTPCDELDDALINSNGLNTELALSSDSKLLGIIFQARLYVWHLWTAWECTSVALPLTLDKKFEQIRLLALGHLYTVIGLQYSTSLLVVLTQTGQVVKRYDGFAQQYSHMVPPYIELLCVTDEQWLSDIATPCTAQQCVVVYWNRTNRSLEAVLLGGGPCASDQPTPHTARKKSRWKAWRKN